MPSGITVLCDFDGTITTEDVGEALCARFAPGALQRVDARWLAGEISFAEAYRLACLELKAPHAELVAHALAVARVRPGFAELLEACRELGVELVVSSAGLDLYVEPILRAHLGELCGGLELHVNVGRVTLAGVEVSFPHRDPDCAECGNCKAVRARRARRKGRTVVAVGDSYSDRCLVREADHVFARSWLAGHCRDSGIAHREFEEFGPVTALLRRLTQAP